jgi:glutamine kinase
MHERGASPAAGPALIADQVARTTTPARALGAVDPGDKRADCAVPSILRWGKSAALEWFVGRVHTARIPVSWRIERLRWGDQREHALTECLGQLGDRPLAVRSDAPLEDMPQASLAGHFPTLLDVAPVRLEAAIDAVFAGLTQSPHDAVLVQPMVADCCYLGVAATHRIHDGAPWYCIEIATPYQAAVTGGRASGRQLAVARQGGDGAFSGLASPFGEALATLREVEALAPAVALEIEFAVDDAQRVHLLQVRPLAACTRWQAAPARLRLPRLDALDMPDALPAVRGERSVWSLMSDWNPAELIGTHPRPLALSLFRDLIGCGRWWNARARLGYQPPPHRRVQLLRVVGGRPYVDVRRSANSMLPAGLTPDQRQQVVDGWIRILAAQPELHDKVEFSVYRAVQDFAMPAACIAGALTQGTLSAWNAALARMTRDMLAPGHLATIIAAMEATSSAVGAGRARTSPATAIAALARLTQARRGAHCFAMLARLAFAGDAQLRSAVSRGALEPQRALQLRASRPGVARLLAPSVDAGGVTASDHGHLRPGTFDITRATWADSNTRTRFDPGASDAPFQFAPGEQRDLNRLLQEAGLGLDAPQWMQFVLDANEAREWGKYMFSRHVSAVLEGIAEDLALLDLDRDTASWLDLAQLRRHAALPPTARAHAFRAQAQAARQRHREQQWLMLSPVLRQPADIGIADSLGTLPNFVGEHMVDAAAIVVDAGQAAPERLRGAVVVLRHADPGYDWLFDCGIAGLLTAWGGAHSHMAIRCAEFGLSAALGCGEPLFERACRASRVRIDPRQGMVWLD